MNGIIFDLKEFAVHDGPGLRTTVFLKGCPLRCLWCHNPEGMASGIRLITDRTKCRDCGLCRTECGHPDCRPYGRCLHICPENALTLCGTEITADGLEEHIRRNQTVIADGGVTFSGGEPLMQADFLTEMLTRLKDLPTAVETCGDATEAVFRRVLEQKPFFFFDLKLADDTEHRRFTGRSNLPILRNFALLRESGLPYTVRTPLIPGITDTEENLSRIRALIGSSDWQTLPYNDLAGAKYRKLGIPFPYREFLKGETK